MQLKAELNARPITALVHRSERTRFLNSASFDCKDKISINKKTEEEGINKVVRIKRVRTKFFENESSK